MDSRRLATVICVALAAMLLGLPGAAGAKPATSGAADGRAGSPWPVADVMGAEHARWRIATTANREVKINAQMVIASVVVSGVCARCGPGGTDTTEERCRFAIFVQFPHVAGAASYNVVVQDKHPRVNTTRNFTGPPFNDNIEGYKTPGGAHWFGGLTGGAGPAPCPTDPYEGGRFEILKAVAIFDGKGRIVGTVRKADGTGAAGTRVTASGTSTVSTKTTAGGGYSMKVKDGRYQVSAKGYCVVGPAGCKKSKTVKVKDGPQQVDFGPRPRVTLAGRVIERSCDHAVCSEPAGLGGAEVTASSLDGESPALASSGPDGAWSVEVPSGRWKVRAAQAGRSLMPSSRKFNAKKDVTGLDFESCLFTGTPAGPSCDPDGIDWSMPDRLTLDTPKKHFTDIGLPDKAFLDPRTWETELFLTKAIDPLPSACRRAGNDVRWRWIVKPSTAVKGKVPDGCRTEAMVTRLGDYNVTAVKERRRGGEWEEEHRVGPVKVTLDDVVLAGVGDSSASGEGNPKFYFEQCDRSVVAYQFQAALFVEQEDPHTTVTFLHPACSGARLDHMWKREFRGTRGDAHLPPQLHQIASRLTRKDIRRKPKIDAAMAGVGVNDIGFGPVLEYCLAFEHQIPAFRCPDGKVKAELDADGFVVRFYSHEAGRPLSDWIDDMVGARALRPKYAAFMREVRAGLEDGGLGLRKTARVLLTQYPNFSRNKDGVCDTSGNTLPPRWFPSTWGWMGDLGERLSKVIRGSSALGYTVVPMTQETFHPHGYCVYDGTSWFVGIFESRWRQGNVNGGFHPNAAGHGEMAAETRATLCEALYGNPACQGRFRG